MEMHSPQILIPTTLRAPLDKSRLSSQYENSPEVDSELSQTHSMHPLTLRPSASQTQPEVTFDTVLTKQLPGHLAQRQESPIDYTASVSERDQQNASPTGLIHLNSPLGSQESVSSLVSATLPVVRVEKMSPQQTCDSTIQSFGISPASLASIQQATIELTSAAGRPIQCAPTTLPQQQSQTLLQTAKPVQPKMVQLAPVPAGIMPAVKPALVQPPPIQPAPAHTSLLKLAPVQPVPTKKNKKLSPKKNILCKDREYDVNKHCGVWVEADHRQCTRSLTCKTHALSLRRAVKGRRKPFDELLAEHKARSQALAATHNPSLIKKPVPPPPTPAGGLPGHSMTQGNSAARPTTPKVLPPRPNTPKATTPKALTPKLSTPRTQTASLHVKAEPGVKPQVMFQKIMPVPGPIKTFNLNSVLPTKTPHPSLPQRVTSTDPEVPSPESRPSLPEAAGSGSGSSGGHVKPGPAEKGAEMKDKSDFSCSHHHPRPVAMCSYGARQVGKGLYAFNRRLDHLRSTMAALVEKHTSRPPPLKKMCLSNEPLEDVAMDTSPPSDAPNLQMNNSASSHSAASTSAFSFSSVSLFDAIPSGSKIPAATCGNSSNNGVDSVSWVKSLPNAVQNNFSKGAAKKLSKVASKTPGKSGDGKGLSSMQHPVKNSKARRKSGSSGGGKSNASASVTVAQNLFSVSSASPVTLTPASSAYSIVTNSGLQLGGGVVGLDPATLSGQEISDNLLKNVHFVLTNGGAAATANSATPQATSNFTVPILNATIGNALGNTPVLLGNLGALALPYDRKLNVKSRTKSASSAKSAMERQGRRLSGGSTVTGLQNIAIVNPPFVECPSQETMGVGGGGGGVGGGSSEAGFTVNMCQSLQSPQSNAPSPQLRPNSASPQLSSPIPNGIIPSPTNITFKPYPGTVIGTSTVANHVQRGMSPSRTSTPSPGTGSTEASPNISAHLVPGSFTTSGKLSLVSPKGSSHNLPKSTLNQKHSHAHLHHRSIAQLTSQQQLQQQQQQQQQQQGLQFHQLQLTPQQISSLVAMDAQGKQVPLGSALIPGLFQSIPTQPVNPGALQGGLTLAPAVAADQGGKVLSQSAVLSQGAIALHLQQPGSGQPIRLQGADQSQMGMSQEEDNRQELKMQH